VPSDADRTRSELVAFARSYETRKHELDRAADQLREERDEAIVRAFNGGLTTREIAGLLGEISHQRVAQIVQQR